MEWYKITARSATRDMWIGPEWHRKPPLGPHVLHDGRDIPVLIDDGRLDQIPFEVWCQPFNSGKRMGDMLWAGGTGLKLVSQRFVAALESIDATGYRTFDIPLRTRKGEPIPGYVGFATTSEDNAMDIRHLLHHQNFTFRVRPRVVEALRAAGADDLIIEPFDSEEYTSA